MNEGADIAVRSDVDWRRFGKTKKAVDALPKGWFW